MKYVRMKSGEIEIMEDGASIPADSETIFSTEPAVYEGTWDKPVSYVDHADVVVDQKGEETDKYKVDEKLGTQKTFIEKRLAKREKQMGWSEPTKAHPKDKVCLNCGKIMKGVRPNKKFCSDKCRKDYSQRGRRAEAKTVKQFKPHMGKEGQIYYMLNGKIEFIPALWCDSKKRCEKYIKDNITTEEQVSVLEQVQEVMKK